MNQILNNPAERPGPFPSLAPSLAGSPTPVRVRLRTVAAYWYVYVRHLTWLRNLTLDASSIYAPLDLYPAPQELAKTNANENKSQLLNLGT